jgi:hypothetical protein
MAHQDELLTEIEEYFQKNIQCKFPLKHYVFDIYRKHQGSYLLIDFNLFDSVTEPLLYEWDELTNKPVPGSNEHRHAMFRLVASDAGIQPNKDAYSRLPIDVVDLSTGNDIEKFVDLFKKVGQRTSHFLSWSIYQSYHLIGSVTISCFIRVHGVIRQTQMMKTVDNTVNLYPNKLFIVDSLVERIFLI